MAVAGEEMMMRRVLASAGVLTAIMLATTGMAAANADRAPLTIAQQANPVRMAEAPSGTTGFGAAADNTARPIVDTGSGTQLGWEILRLIGWLANGSSEPCTGLCGPF
ncbi:hypothetical protein Q3A91_09320 [Nocardia mangyaensis]|nr:hypothetical protein [Nocardia mangyaensis]